MGSISHDNSAHYPQNKLKNKEIIFLHLFSSTHQTEEIWKYIKDQIITMIIIYTKKLAIHTTNI